MGRSVIRRVKPAEADILTEISLKSKAYWNYPESFFGTWLPELTITSQYVEDNMVHAVQLGERLVGYYSLVLLQHDREAAGEVLACGYWLEHMFVLPRWIGRGYGTAMMDHLRALCRTRGIDTLKVLADPNARQFYEKTGWRFLRDYPSTIPGRTTPMLQLALA